MRQTIAKTGRADEEETDAVRGAAIAADLEAKGATVIYSHPERVQAMRHQTGQIGGLGALDLNEIQRMRAECENRIKQIEDVYYTEQEKKRLGAYFKDKYKLDSTEME